MPGPVRCSSRSSRPVSSVATPSSPATCRAQPSAPSSGPIRAKATRSRSSASSACSSPSSGNTRAAQAGRRMRRRRRTRDLAVGHRARGSACGRRCSRSTSFAARSAGTSESSPGWDSPATQTIAGAGLEQLLHAGLEPADAGAEGRLGRQQAAQVALLGLAVEQVDAGRAGRGSPPRRAPDRTVCGLPRSGSRAPGRPRSAGRRGRSRRRSGRGSPAASAERYTLARHVDRPPRSRRSRSDWRS